MKIKLYTLVLIAFSVFISGCSSKDAPDVSDVEPGIRAFWGACTYEGKPQFKVTDIEKTNGINRGRTYEVFFTYKITLLSTHLMASMDGMTCPSIPGILMNLGITNEDDLHKGVVMQGQQNMIPSENGWVVEE